MTDRAVSTAVGYVLLLAVAAVMLSTLTLGLADLVDSRDEQATHAELTVYGERLAADLSTADRLLQQSSGETTLTVTSDLPETVNGHQYTITVDEDADASEVTEIRLRATGVDRPVETRVQTTTPVAQTEVEGGPLRLSATREPSKDENRPQLTIHDA